MGTPTKTTVGPDWLNNAVETFGKVMSAEPADLFYDSSPYSPEEQIRLREKGKADRIKKHAEYRVNNLLSGSTNRDEFGKLKELTFAEKWDMVDEEDLLKEVNKKDTEVGIIEAFAPGTNYEFGDIKYNRGDLGVDAPSMEGIETKAQATKLMREKLLKVINANKGKQATVDDEIKYGTLVPGEGGKPGVRTGGTVQGRAELDLNKVTLDKLASTIELNRRTADLAQDKFEYQQTHDQKERNYKIKVLEMEAQALAEQRAQDNAQAILLHDKQHLSNMEFFDKKKDAYDEERLMDYIQGGVNGLGSLFQLFML